MRYVTSTTPRHTSASTLRAQSTDLDSLPTSTTYTESTPVSRILPNAQSMVTPMLKCILETPLEESIGALDELRRAGKTKYIGLSECSAATLRKANSSTFLKDPTCHQILRSAIVAKIDAVQAEYSAFETLHETNGLIDTAKELGVAFIAFSPLGHGWLVDDFKYKSPDEFAPDDFRRTGTCVTKTLNPVSLVNIGRSAQVPGGEFL